MNMIFRIATELNHKEDDIYEKEYIWMLRWLDFFSKKDKARSEEMEMQRTKK